jgi:predicted nicotinamide N-methyase
VIELGSGPGAVGLAAAALGAAAAVLTDLPHVLPLAAANIEVGVGWVGGWVLQGG